MMLLALPVRQLRSTQHAEEKKRYPEYNR